MKRKVIVSVVFLILIAISVNAQGKSFGIKGGLSISNFWGDGMDNLNNQIDLDEKNLLWGVISLYSTREFLPDLISLQSELVYSRGGKRWSGNIDGNDVDLRISIDYISMPWLMKLNLPVLMKPSIYIGPQVSWMFRARVEDLPSDIAAESFFADINRTTGSGLFERYVNVIDIGFAAGLDFNIPLGPGSAVIDFRYNQGFLNVFNFDEGDDIHNYSFFVMAGYQLDFGAGF
jgi:hypothetical protein